MIELQKVNNESKDVSKNNANLNKNEENQLFKNAQKKPESDDIKVQNIPDPANEDKMGTAKDNARRFNEERVQKEREEINNKIKVSKEKNLKSIMKKILTLTEVIIEKKLKIVDFIMAIFILINIVLTLTQNDRFTSPINCPPVVTSNNSQRILSIVTVTKNLTINSSISSDQVYDKNEYYDNEYLRDLQAASTICVKAEYVADNLTDYMRWINVGIVVLIEILLLVRYILKLKILRSSFKACRNDNFCTTGLWRPYLIESLVLAVFTPPKISGTFKGRMLFGEYQYSYDSIITFFVIFKLYYMIRIYSNVSLWTSERVKSIGIDNKISIGAHFAIKAQIKHTPYIAMGLMLAISIGIFGFMMRIFEYGFKPDAGAAVSSKAVNNPNFKTFTDTFWVIIITMMTIGYGDIFPNTHFGRIIAFLSALVGMLIVSLLIVSLSYVVEFSPEEKKAHNLIKKFNANDQMKRFTTSYIKSLMKLFYIKSNNSSNANRGYNSKFKINFNI